MSAEPQLFRVNPDNRESERIEEVDFATLGLRERQDIQEWVAANPGILGDDLLIIGKEFSGFDRTNERLDLLAVDADGKLVIIELKRDDTGADAHWQAIKYASYFNRAGPEDIVGLLAKHGNLSDADAQDRLLEHIESSNLEVLNNDQRIILASHRFAPEVTSAALWLNQKSPGEDLITCIQLTPYQDANTESLYIQANTIIPIPGIDDYIIGIGDSPDGNAIVARGTSTRKQTSERNRTDDITRFLRKVADITVTGLTNELQPDKRSRWAGGGSRRRRFNLWYSQAPWRSGSFCYSIQLDTSNQSSDDSGPERFHAFVSFQYLTRGNYAFLTANEVKDLDGRLQELHIQDDQEFSAYRPIFNGIRVPHKGAALNDDFANILAGTLKRMIEVVTPVVDEFEAARNEEDA